MDDDFVISQWEYFGRLLGCGNSSDRSLIYGCYRTYEDEARKRNLIKLDFKKNCFVLVTDRHT